jgi:hypothetical protein
MIKNEMSSINFNLLLSKEEVWNFQKRINDFGPYVEIINDMISFLKYM